ncbi:MAG: bacteriohopanetetrol glucosamine biosynthesis glycosyltransferase HpnI [Candidatus Korobacteraceae bacterium]|jgi:ceramide glucosyltransferase
MHLLLAALAWVFTALALCGLGYQFLVMAGIAKFRRLRRRQPAAMLMPPISILKPLRGSDPLMYEAFRSHCLQDYPAFELIFGVADESDPAAAEVRRLQREFPAQPVKLIVCPQTLGTNRKVSTLVQLLPSARHELILVNDSDILVPPDYLRKIAAGFANGRAGLVTALYRALPGPTLASRLEALTISTDFAGSVLAAWAVERKLNFGLGSTLAVRRQALEAIGGWVPLLDYLADDYEVGNRMARAGFEVALSTVVVETALPGASFREMFQHQLRWARTIRDRRLRGYIGLGISHAVPWALLACLCAGFAPWSLGLLAGVALLRLVVAALCKNVLHDDLADLWLLPLRDLAALLVWIVCFAGETVEWRGETFRLRHGKLEKI